LTTDNSRFRSILLQELSARGWLRRCTLCSLRLIKCVDEIDIAQHQLLSCPLSTFDEVRRVKAGNSPHKGIP
jgi:hypothetical protein